MPGFFSKLFRRKAASSVDEHKKTPTAKKPNSRRLKGKQQDVPVTNGGAVKPQALEPAKEANGVSSRNRQNAGNSPSGSSSGIRAPPTTSRVEVETVSKLSPRPISPRVLSPRNQAADVIVKPVEKIGSGDKQRSVGPVDLDEESLGGNEPDENQHRKKIPQSGVSPRLSFQQLEQFNKQQQPTRSPTQISRPIYHMPVDEGRRPQLTASQKEAMDDTNQSDASSSSFNLSTDAEDTEYEDLKKGRIVPPLNALALDTSGISGASGPTNYTTDEERAIFPALLTDDEGNFTEQDSVVGTRVPLGGFDDDASKPHILPMPYESADDIRAWTISPSTQASFKDTVASASPQFSSFTGNSSNGFLSAQNMNNSFSSSPNVASSGATTRRNFTTPAFSDDFADFAEFDKVAFPTVDPKPHKEVTKPPDSQKHRLSRSVRVEADFPIEHLHSTSSRRHHYSSASAAQPDSTISDLLAQAKRTSRSKKPSSSSVNSAPTVTAQYLRQHHNLRSLNGERDARPSDKATSVSDIIQNLELTNASRAKASSSRKSSSRSTGDHADTLSNHSKDGTSASLRSAKDRLKEKRRKERELSGSSSKHRSRSNELDSSDPSDNEASESWLFDEVTGALGPRGVAADLESLSGRSNRSKSSGGNKSHRSHKSHRSQRSSRRRQGRSSSDSVESRGSKTSRNSRYSHRSTRSYISQMSEQSRSVANDLLRLEMQLAMVGSQENVEEAHVRTGGSVASSVGGASRASRTSRTSTRASALVRRSKIDVVAPPGKLGIILANKADSKGTVVSGVRTSSVLAEKISPGDRIVAIDGEDVSRMTVSEITTIMARKSDFERVLTVLTTPRHMITDPNPVRSPTAAAAAAGGGGGDFESSSYGYRR